MRWAKEVNKQNKNNGVKKGRRDVPNRNGRIYGN
jgi:hypothetical protein